jgi:hypothetical protein
MWMRLLLVQRQHKKLLAQAFVKHAKNRNGKKEQREMRPTKWMKISFCCGPKKAQPLAD